MTDYFIDFETRSPVPIRDGTDKYLTRAEATICTLAVGNGPVRCWDILHESQPLWFTQAVQDPHAVFIAHNGMAFDRGVMSRCLKIPTKVEQWCDTRSQAYAHGLPGGLEGLCAALGVTEGESKDAGGKQFIQLFCVPDKQGNFRDPKDYPDEWAAFKQYAMRDVYALRAIWRRLPTHNFTGVNLRYYWLDAKINERGFAVDLPLIEAAVDLLDRAKSRGDDEVSLATAGAVTAITQRDKLLKYLQSKGLMLPNLRKSELENALQSDDLSPESRLLIESRLEGARASGAKYKRALSMQVGGRLRYTMQFSGAGRTGRTAHKGFQPGNMPRAVTYNALAETLAEQHVPLKAKFIDEVILPAIRDGSALESAYIFGGPNTVAANALRHTLIAAPGYEFVCADYKNIESRKVAWLAGEAWKIALYEAADQGEAVDAYKTLYSRFFGADILTINDHQRNAGKVIELACGFGGSVGAFVTMAVGYGIDLSTLPALVLPNADAKAITKAETVWWRAWQMREDYDLEPDVYIACHVLVQKYRAANPKIDGLKKSLGRAVETAVKIRGSFHEVGRCKIWANADLLIVELPSGYRLCYWAPEVASEEIMDPETGEVEDRMYLTFKRARGPRMIKERSWSGLILENIVQSCANQILRHGSLEVEKEFPGAQVLSVHDEILCEVPIGTMTVEQLTTTMCRVPQWARGLPLAADGWRGVRYGKR